MDQKTPKFISPNDGQVHMLQQRMLVQEAGTTSEDHEDHCRAALADFLWDVIGCTQTQSKQFIRDVLDGIALFDFKQKRYGPKNVADGGELGMSHRISEKAKRLENMLTLTHVDQTISEPVVHKVQELTCDEETRRETWQDMGVIGFMGVSLHDRSWPGVRNLRLVELESRAEDA